MGIAKRISSISVFRIYILNFLIFALMFSSVSIIEYTTNYLLIENIENSTSNDSLDIEFEKEVEFEDELEKLPTKFELNIYNSKNKVGSYILIHCLNGHSSEQIMPPEFRI